MRKRFLYLLYIILLFSITSCIGKYYLKPINSSLDKGEYTKNIINSNNNCELPCFWGIEIGKTTYEEVYPYLNSFATHITNPKITKSGSETFTTSFYYPEDDIDFWIEYNMIDNVIRRIVTSVINKNYSYISISDIMQTYGVPTEVYFEKKMNMQLNWDTSITIFYENINVSFWFETDDQPELENGNIYSCYQGSPAITIWSAELWNKEQKITFYDLFPFLDENYPNKNQANLPEVFEIKEVTDWTVEDFYLHFYNNNEFCVEIINR